MKKILTIVGARPQFIKAAAISHVVRDKYAGKIAEDILHTGQHYDAAMSARFFDELDIPRPRYNLGVGSGSHGVQTAAMLEGVEAVLLAERYDGVLVYGDTNSTLAGALAAAKLHVPVYHVEAGLRSYNRAMPEELNRLLTDHASTLLFAPTATAVHNLEKEGFEKERVVAAGDVMLDNVMHYRPEAVRRKKWPLDGRPMILATVHRDFNTDDPKRLRAIVEALERVGERLDATVVFPVHPRTRGHMAGMGGDATRLRCVEPLSYLETLSALDSCRLVMTDSGGLQKEAFFCGRPCVVLRPETEWAEIVDCGAARLADADVDAVVCAAEAMWDAAVPRPTQFGDGHAAERILDAICC